MKIYEIGPEIRRLRKIRGITQEELSKEAGISRVTLSKIENGRTWEITITTFMKILARLGREISIIEPKEFPTIEDRKYDIG